MNVVFRVDASIQMGMGHFMRCLTLAEELRSNGTQIHFICREHSGNLIHLLKQKSIPVSVLPKPVLQDTTSDENYAHWLGATQSEDAKQTIEALGAQKPDWLIVDHYSLDHEWEQKLRPHVSKLMVIDDLANRQHDCDILLDQNFSTEGDDRYIHLVPKTCALLLGPRYALLRPEYVTLRKTLRIRDGKVKKVLVFFGGTDPQNLTGLTLQALNHTSLKHLEIDVVVGTNNPHLKAIEEQILSRPHTNLHKSLPHLADLMAQADLALGAGGASTWERMCLGLPTILISFAENQRPASQALAKAKLIDYAGHFNEINRDQLVELLQNNIQQADKLSEISTQNKLQVDGLGASRLAEVLYPTTIDDLRLRSACEEDSVLYYNWANDPTVRESAIHSEPIAWHTHQAWFSKKLNDKNSYLYILEAKKLPSGQIRFDQKNGEATIDYSLDKIVRGRGWGKKLVSLGIEQLQNKETKSLQAQVKKSNKASQSVFLNLGFTMAQNKNLIIFSRSLTTETS